MSEGDFEQLEDVLEQLDRKQKDSEEEIKSNKDERLTPNKLNKVVRLNKVDRISLSGGLIGLLFTDPRGALDSNIMKNNSNGWECHQIFPHSSDNLFITILQTVVLIITLGIWTWGAGYIVLYKKYKNPVE